MSLLAVCARPLVSTLPRQAIQATLQVAYHAHRVCALAPLNARLLSSSSRPDSQKPQSFTSQFFSKFAEVTGLKGQQIQKQVHQAQATECDEELTLIENLIKDVKKLRKSLQNIALRFEKKPCPASVHTCEKFKVVDDLLKTWEIHNDRCLAELMRTQIIFYELLQKENTYSKEQVLCLIKEVKKAEAVKLSLVKLIKRQHPHDVAMFNKAEAIHRFTIVKIPGSPSEEVKSQPLPMNTSDESPVDAWKNLQSASWDKLLKARLITEEYYRERLSELHNEGLIFDMFEKLNLKEKREDCKPDSVR